MNTANYELNICLQRWLLFQKLSNTANFSCYPLWASKQQIIRQSYKTPANYTDSTRHIRTYLENRTKSCPDLEDWWQFELPSHCALLKFHEELVLQPWCLVLIDDFDGLNTDFYRDGGRWEERGRERTRDMILDLGTRQKNYLREGRVRTCLLYGTKSRLTHMSEMTWRPPYCSSR